MITVEEVNKTFAQKGLHIEIPLEGSRPVKKIDVLEKIHAQSRVRVLLRVKYINETGKEVSELFSCEGSVKKEKKVKAKVLDPLKSESLPVRDTTTFSDEAEALDYLKEAISHLLQDKGYSLGETKDADLHFVKEEQEFFVNLAVRCDEKGLERAKELIQIRKSQGLTHDYGLVVPAFQESLDLPLRLQERWIARNQEYLSTQRVGIYSVDNMDPNRIYSFSIYPRALDLKKYFMRTTQSWSLIRSRYVQERVARKKAEKTGEDG